MYDDLEHPPSIADVIAWRDLLVSEFAALRDEQEKEEDVYFQKFPQQGLSNTKAVRTGSAPSDADSAVDTLVPVDIQVTVQPARRRDKYEQQAELLARFGLALIKSWRKKKDPLRRLVNDMVIRRLCVARVLFDDARWPSPVDADDADDDDWNARYRRKCPIVLERRDPRYVGFRDDDDGTILALAEHYETTVLEARAAYSEYPEAQRVLARYDVKQKVYVSDVWLGRWRCLLIEDQPVFPGGDVIEHGYDEIPYRIAAFRELPFEEMEKRFRGMLTNAVELYPTQSQVLSMQVEMLKWNAWRTWIGWTWDNRELDIYPGTYLQIDKRKGEYLEMLTGETVPPEVLQMTAVLDSYIERNGMSQGPSTSEGTRSGQMIWAIQAIRQMKVEAARQDLLELVEGALQLSSMIVERKITGRLTLPLPGKDHEGKARGEVSISAKDIDGYWDGWNVSFGKRLDPATLEQGKALSALVANKFMPYKVGVELSGLAETPQQWEDDLLLQASNSDPMMVQLMVLEQLIGYYGDESWQARTMMQRIMESMPQPGQQAGPMQPGGGTMQPPSMAGPSMASAMRPSNGASPRGRTPAPRTPSGGAAPVPIGGGR